MARSEWLARITVILVLVGIPLLILGFQYGLRPAISTTRIIDISARIPEVGGFSPNVVHANINEPVTLRFSSVDVVHGIAIGPGLGVDLGHIDPGTVKEITLTFDHTGTYTYYCNTWCSADHWRMRGIIEVRDPSNPDSIPITQTDPVITTLQAEGANIDAERSIYIPVIGMKPSALRGEDEIISLNVPSELQDKSWQRTHTPVEALELLKSANPNQELIRLIDAIAYLWTSQNNEVQMADSANLYAKNCAACHGETGGGDGPFATLTSTNPVAFSNPAYMFLMRGDVLYAKIRRGGMGTNMPNFGTLFTPDETRLLIDYLWTQVMQAD